MPIRVDLNCDMGESFGMYKLGNDEGMMQYITSANIACGYHGGDPHVMRRTVALALEHGVKVGAHPSFPDLLGFGRRHMNCSPSEIKDYVIYQTGALREFSRIYGASLQHCKPHGALYMMAMEEESIARAILEAIAEVDEKMLVYAFNNSAVAELGRQMGIPIALEVYADREHTATGSIVLTRSGPDITDYAKMAERVLKMVTTGTVRATTGEDIKVKAETVCIHGDTRGAVELAKAIAEMLESAGVVRTSAKEVIAS